MASLASKCCRVVLYTCQSKIGGMAKLQWAVCKVKDFTVLALCKLSTIRVGLGITFGHTLWAEGPVLMLHCSVFCSMTSNNHNCLPLFETWHPASGYFPLDAIDFTFTRVPWCHTWSNATLMSKDSHSRHTSGNLCLDLEPRCCGEKQTGHVSRLLLNK